ncbi:MAG TPA: KamA family protein, partial [Bacteroidales bacterium]|nr:KamA family protein [Bacteroidales bacterium]
MKEIEKLDRIAISVRSHRLLKILMNENPELEKIMQNSKNETEVLVGVKHWIKNGFEDREQVIRDFYYSDRRDKELFEKLQWFDYAIIRLLDYIDYAGLELPDLNLHGEIAVSNPLRLLWLAVNKGTGGAKPDFFIDIIELFRQLNGTNTQVLPDEKEMKHWMDRYPDGLDPRIIQLRKENRDRILQVLVRKMETGDIQSQKYCFEEGSSFDEKMQQARKWWKLDKFHLHFAIRSPGLLNEMLNNSLDPDTVKVLEEAHEAGIPFFVNLYYLSLLHVRVPYFAVGADLAIRYYVLYNKQLVNEFGQIVAWEKEDKVEPGKPNAAGWILPEGQSIHRRYPEVAILIPDTMGRTCGGLCSSCQRMYDFQSGHFNFNLQKLKPDESWPEKLKRLLTYFEEDTQLRDILITGGDAFMSSNRSIKHILNEICDMAQRKRKRNKELPDREKKAEIVRIRFGTRLLAYLPQRINDELVNILSDFKEKASSIGIRQFIVQAHFESAMEITPETKTAVEKIISAGWLVTNQLVFTMAASRRGHSARLRKVLNDIGILPYYTFTVKGYMENNFSFTPNARIVQEELEEKVMGKIGREYYSRLMNFAADPENIQEHIDQLRTEAGLPFLAADRNVLNLP